MSDELNFVMAARREKMEAMRAVGIEPFAYSFDRTHTASEAVALAPADQTGESDVKVRAAGRVVSIRGHGKTVFAHLADASGRVQLYFRRDDIGEAFTRLDFVDIGDFIGVSGAVFRTRSGEATIRVAGFEILAKSLRPLPFGKEEVAADGTIVKHMGFSDPEQRFRQRYADLAVNADVRATFVARAKMTSAIRGFLDARGYLEV
ncbi:MAG: OB-fold nucleic acid binding domain-containing protein, partial [Gemmatimonadota bacterium]|nr:OB-fold nucleic acid binding domain-containing protein [Gemmatimonadota bacterium]